MNLKKEKITSPILNTKEAGEYLKVSIFGIYKYVRENRIPYYKPLNGKIKFKISDLDNFLFDEKFRVPSNAEIEKKVLNEAI